MALCFRVFVCLLSLLGLGCAERPSLRSGRHHAKVLLGTSDTSESRQLRMRAFTSAHQRLDLASEIQDTAEAEVLFFTRDVREQQEFVAPLAALLETSALLEVAGPPLPATPKVKDTDAGKKKMKKTLGDLEHLFDHMKSNIGFYNKKEKEMKSKTEGKLEEEKKKLEELQDQAKAGHLSAFDAMMNKNATEMTSRLVQYWTQVREGERSQYRNSLEMTHTLMSRIKMATKVYGDRIDGKRVDMKAWKALKLSLPPASSPKAVLVQRQAELKTYRSEMRKLVREGVEASLRLRLD